MASFDRDEREELDQSRFDSIIEEYSSSFKNPPKNARQLVQFCKDREYDYKYGELNPFFSIWNKQKQQEQQEQQKKQLSITPAGSDDDNEEEQEQEIDWDAFWSEYEEKYQYPPKKAIHLWNFAKEEKFVNVKYKEARIAFDRIFSTKTVSSPVPIEGHSRAKSSSSTTSLKSFSAGGFEKTTSGMIDDKIELSLKVTKYTPSEEKDSIKASFLDLLEAFRKSITADPASPLQLFNFINEETEYRVRYGDVKKCYNYANKEEWYKPMKRVRKKNKKKVSKKSKDEEGLHSDVNNDGDNEEEEEGVEYVLEVDHEKLEAEKRKEDEEKKEIVYSEVMSDDEYDKVLIKYNKEYNNPPRNASQIMNFAKEINQFYKYKACRIAFNRWKNVRGAVMPEINEDSDGDGDGDSDKDKDTEEENEPGTVQNTDNDDNDEDDNENEEEEDEEESE